MRLRCSQGRVLDTSDNFDHVAAVDAWIARAGPAGPGLHAFERAFNALWARAVVTLGEVTLGAIADRVLYVAAERCAPLAKLRVETDGIRVADLLGPHAEDSDPALAEGCRAVLIELLTVIGNLTAEILSPALHAELASFAELPQSDAVQKVRR